MNRNTRYVPTFIDGHPYVVRLLTSDEWDKIIDTVGANNSLLHYSQTASWTQDRRDDWSSRFIVRGGAHARTKDSYSATDGGPRVGYRPCLEPLNLDTFEPDSSRFFHMKDGDVLTFGSMRMGNYVVPIPKNRTSEGEIESYSPYALPHVSIGDSCSENTENIQWVKVGNLLVADRNILKYISLQHLNMCQLVYGETQKPIDRAFEQPNSVYKQDDLTYHTYNGVNMNIQDMLENACWKALHSNCNYKVSLSVDGGYKMSLNFCSVAEQNDVALISVDDNRAYVQKGPAWERIVHRNIENIDNLISSATQRSNQTTPYREMPKDYIKE